ncbi:MAG: DUF4129 domain-containing protein [Kofleriaceae bacterium]
MVRFVRLVTVLVVLVAVPAHADDDGLVQREADRALAGHQRELPGFDRQAGADGGAGGEGRAGGGRAGGGRAGDPGNALDRWREARRRRDGTQPGRPGDGRDDARATPSRSSSSRSAPPGGAASGLANVLLWGVVLTALAMIAVSLYRQFSNYVADEEPADEGPGRPRRDAALAAVIERPRDDADQLAAEGRYVEAIHVLLLRTLHELASQHLVRVTPASTSRELLAQVNLAAEPRAALADLVTAVEHTWFGDALPGAADYAACRAQFDRFAGAYQRRAREAA